MGCCVRKVIDSKSFADNEKRKLIAKTRISRAPSIETVNVYEYKTEGVYNEKAVAWLNEIMSHDRVGIYHAENRGRLTIYSGSDEYYVDGFCEESNTVYEFIETGRKEDWKEQLIRSRHRYVYIKEEHWDDMVQGITLSNWNKVGACIRCRKHFISSLKSTKVRCGRVKCT